MISPTKNSKLLAPFTIQEIWEVVFSFPPDKALSPDGFTTLFFHICWDFIGCDLLVAMEESKKFKSMLKYFNSINIAIIPKTKEPKNFVDFYPISLYNLTYKIITKAIYLWLKKLFHS